MHFTIHGVWIYVLLIGGVAGVLYNICIIFKLIKYYLAGNKCAGFVNTLEYHSSESGDKYNLVMEYYYSGEKICGTQEDFVKMEKPFTAQAKYTSGAVFDIIVSNKDPRKYILRHRFTSSVWAAVVGVFACAVLAVIMAKLCIFGFSI